MDVNGKLGMIHVLFALQMDQCGIKVVKVACGAEQEKNRERRDIWVDEGHAFNFFQGFQVGTSSNGTTVAPLHRLGSQTCGAD